METGHENRKQRDKRDGASGSWQGESIGTSPETRGANREGLDAVAMIATRCGRTRDGAQDKRSVRSDPAG